MNKLLLEILAYCTPALIVGVISYYFFLLHYKNEENRRRFQLIKENQKNAFPLRIQAYERITLFLDRISPQKILLRVRPENQDKKQYEFALIQQIDSEFDHNTTQQLYISEASWNVVKAAKSATIQIIRKAAINPENETAQDMQTAILSEFIEKQTPSNNAISHIVNEMKDFLG